MRRKVLQHFANMFPQRFLDLTEGFDLAVFARHKTGSAHYDHLTADAVLDGVVQPERVVARDYRASLQRELESHGIALGSILAATMDVRFDVTDEVVKRSHGQVFRSATFSFECTSEVSTDERKHGAAAGGARPWEYGYYRDRLYST